MSLDYSVENAIEIKNLNKSYKGFSLKDVSFNVPSGQVTGFIGQNGGKIIKETFRNLGDEEYRKMAYEVARYHHEKWNGRGYPEGIKEENIPLCARIMAVADVFDAVSEKRCYRDAMPLDKCFEIIKQGIGTDFDPVVAKLFVDIREKVEEIHARVNEG